MFMVALVLLLELLHFSLSLSLLFNPRTGGITTSPSWNRQVEDTSCTSGSKTRKRTLGEGRDTLMDYYQTNKYPYSERPMTELDQYMQEPGLSADESSVLQWWKEHNLTYPTIARMACDILAVPLSVDCSVAIKTARRTICESSSLWREEVVCIQDWLRSDGSSRE